jgi:hypothetical protein
MSFCATLFMIAEPRPRVFDASAIHLPSTAMGFFIVPILLVVVVLAIVGAIAYSAHKAEKKRTEQFPVVAQQLGFEFFPLGDPDLLEGLQRFHLFSQGHSKKLWNLLRGTTNQLEVSIFDYRFTTGHGKHRHISNQSVICFKFNGQSLPHFVLRPESVWHKVGTWFGQQDIDFDSHPHFSSKYLLRGSDENAVRTLFSDPVLEFYEQAPGLCTEASDQTLLYYKHQVRIDPQAVRSFMEDGFKVLALFHSDGSGTST